MNVDSTNLLILICYYTIFLFYYPQLLKIGRHNTGNNRNWPGLGPGLLLISRAGIKLLPGPG